MKCIAPIRLLKGIDLAKYPQGIELPCGQCMPCRIARRDAWTLRLMHELLYWDKSMFLTLTYNEDNLPPNGSLLPNDLTKFFKRLRKAIGDRKIKYFACGDYGEENCRPHYHVLLFGMDYLSKSDRQIIKDCWKNCSWEMMKEKQTFGSVNAKSIRYVVRYIESKVMGKEEKYAYEMENIKPTYAVMSKGIGRDYARDNCKKLYEEKECYALGKSQPIPRYYRKILNIESDYLIELLKEKEIDIVEKVTGNRLTRDEAYLLLMPDEIIKIEEEIKNSNKQNELNINARIKNRKRKKGLI